MRWLVVLLLCLAPLAALGQDDDQNLLERLVQDRLSSAGRTVTITGFRGALSSQASLDRLTVADRSGTWLMIENAELTWNRARVLRGEIDITQLSARRITITRRPLPETAAEAAAASGFRLPELPVSLEIDAVDLEELR
ncbi:MAG: hypothetical protein AAF330_04610, partial [Pseudomonadota bacterium]